MKAVERSIPTIEQLEDKERFFFARYGVRLTNREIRMRAKEMLAWIKDGKVSWDDNWKEKWTKGGKV